MEPKNTNKLFDYALGVTREDLEEGGRVKWYGSVDCEDCEMTSSPCIVYAVIKTGMLHKVCTGCDALNYFHASLGTDHVCSQEASGPYRFIPA